jgi:hypothetical protein
MTFPEVQAERREASRDGRRRSATLASASPGRLPQPPASPTGMSIAEQDRMIKRAIAVCALFLPSCVEPEESLETSVHESVFAVGTLWETDLIEVCWEDSAFSNPGDDPAMLAHGRQISERVVMETWGKISRLNIPGGWPRCSTLSDPEIRIGHARVSVASSRYGKQSKGVPSSIIMNVSCAPPGDGGGSCGAGDLCIGPGGNPGIAWGSDTCIKRQAQHEMGHALGFAHEHAHPDHDRYCLREALDGPGSDGEPLWSYEPASVMSYCPARVASDFRLAPGDVRGLLTMYPSQVRAFQNPDFGYSPTGISSRWVFGPGDYLVANTPHLAQIRSLAITPGLRVTACKSGSCQVFEDQVPQLQGALANGLDRLIVTTNVVVTSGRGFTGAAQRLAWGTHRASAGQLSVVGDNQITSIFLPHGVAAVLCDGEGTATGAGTGCTFPFMGSPSTDHQPVYQLAASIDNRASRVDVLPLALGYDQAYFAGNAPILGTVGQVFRSSTHPSLANVRSLLVPTNVQVTLCTNENGTGTCVAHRNSVENLASTIAGQPIRYLAVQDLLRVPPPIQ